ncbi:MAG: bifunctional hydroxymethylpyrimidine kinase/phosphomethylpyrimidine kinase [Acidobacteria bacterium]|nr:bifunctional hydroxymethylpyrimidine kinase/phosphomethylpyrimidine kinase [Acidobacteriota bacterium]
MLRPCVITIAGSDSGGGAGIQADLKAIGSRSVHAATAITAVTAQNSREVTDVFPLPVEIVAAQIDAVMRDLSPSVFKIGMLGTAELTKLVARKIEEWKPRHVVLDPVMIASSGARLLESDAVAALCSSLMPHSTIVTPNWPEAEELVGRSLGTREDLREAALAFREMGARAVLFKGGHWPGSEVIDTLIADEQIVEFRNRRIEAAEGHGTGCTLAAAIAAGLALGEPLAEACRVAVTIVHEALEDRYAVGSSKPLFLAIRR